MASTPTGKPPGRPRKDGLPAGTKPAPPTPEVEPLARAWDVVPMRVLSETACPECWPGVTQFNALGCIHGIRIKKPV